MTRTHIWVLKHPYWLVCATILIWALTEVMEAMFERRVHTGKPIFQQSYRVQVRHFVIMGVYGMGGR